MTEVLSLAMPETQEAILKHSACPIGHTQLQERLIEDGFPSDKLLQVNVFWLITSGELVAGKDYFLASGNNPHQLTFPEFESYFQKSA